MTIPGHAKEFEFFVSLCQLISEKDGVALEDLLAAAAQLHPEAHDRYATKELVVSLLKQQRMFHISEEGIVSLVSNFSDKTNTSRPSVARSCQHCPENDAMAQCQDCAGSRMTRIRGKIHSLFPSFGFITFQRPKSGLAYFSADVFKQHSSGGLLDGVVQVGDKVQFDGQHNPPGSAVSFTASRVWVPTRRRRKARVTTPLLPQSRLSHYCWEVAGKGIVSAWHGQFGYLKYYCGSPILIFFHLYSITGSARAIREKAWVNPKVNDVVFFRAVPPYMDGALVWQAVAVWITDQVGNIELTTSKRQKVCKNAVTGRRGKLQKLSSTEGVITPADHFSGAVHVISDIVYNNGKMVTNFLTEMEDGQEVLFNAATINDEASTKQWCATLVWTSIKPRHIGPNPLKNLLVWNKLEARYKTVLVKQKIQEAESSMEYSDNIIILSEVGASENSECGTTRSASQLSAEHSLGSSGYESSDLEVSPRHDPVICNNGSRSPECCYQIEENDSRREDTSCSTSQADTLATTDNLLPVLKVNSFEAQEGASLYGDVSINVVSSDSLFALNEQSFDEVEGNMPAVTNILHSTCSATPSNSEQLFEACIDNTDLTMSNYLASQDILNLNLNISHSCNGSNTEISSVIQIDSECKSSLAQLHDHELSELTPDIDKTGQNISPHLVLNHLSSLCKEENGSITHPCASEISESNNSINTSWEHGSSPLNPSAEQEPYEFQLLPNTELGDQNGWMLKSFLFLITLMSYLCVWRAPEVRSNNH